MDAFLASLPISLLANYPVLLAGLMLSVVACSNALHLGLQAWRLRDKALGWSAAFCASVTLFYFAVFITFASTCGQG